MERGKRIEALNGEIPLPEAIVQHIQSFLDGKQAARSSVVSKSWYNAWLTRPSLDFDESNFLLRGNGDPNFRVRAAFSEFAKQTMQRYEEQNLNIEKFRLWMKIGERDSCYLANELIVKAMKMGVKDLNFEFDSPTRAFMLPNEVLGAETLVKLCVAGCKISRPADGKVSCSKLRSLELYRVCLENDFVWEIISTCPLIEKLVLSGCDCLVQAKNSTVVKSAGKMLNFRSPSIYYGLTKSGSVIDDPIKWSELQNLKSLFLERVNIDTTFFNDFSIKFPCLEDLSLEYCYGYKRVQISSHSLKCINISQRRVLKAKFNVPAIRKFVFSGSSFPSLAFTPGSSEWESDISITWSRYHLTASWFIELRSMLMLLAPSKISLSIELYLEKQIDCVKDLLCLVPPAVENLQIWVQSPSSVCPALVEGLFSSCCPKAITLGWSPRTCASEKPNSDFLALLCEILMQHVSENYCIPSRAMFGLRGLKDVSVELYEEALAEWRPLPWKMLLDASTGPDSPRKIRFLLGWRK